MGEASALLIRPNITMCFLISVKEHKNSKTLEKG